MRGQQGVAARRTPGTGGVGLHAGATLLLPAPEERREQAPLMRRCDALTATLPLPVPVSCFPSKAPASTTHSPDPPDSSHMPDPPGTVRTLLFDSVTVNALPRFRA